MTSEMTQACVHPGCSQAVGGGQGVRGVLWPRSQASGPHTPTWGSEPLRGSWRGRATESMSSTKSGSACRPPTDPSFTEQSVCTGSVQTTRQLWRREEREKQGQTGRDPHCRLAATQPLPPWFSQNQSQPGRHILPDNKSKLTSAFPLNGCMPLQGIPSPTHLPAVTSQPSPVPRSPPAHWPHPSGEPSRLALQLLPRCPWERAGLPIIV